MTDRIKKSKNDAVLYGVCSGIAKYFKTDPVIIRIAFIFLSLLSGIMIGILTYVLLTLIIPE